MRRADTFVLISHPGAAHFIYELVAAVQRLGFASLFETGYYYSDKGVLSDLLWLLPRSWRERIERQLKRRQFPDLDERFIQQHARRELAYVATARLFPHRPQLAERMLYRRNRYFDLVVAKRILFARHRPKLVVAHDTSGVVTIRTARSLGAVAVLNQVIGHIVIGDRILREEAERHPEWADSLHAGAPTWLIEQCQSEALEADHILAPSDYVKDTLIEIGVAPERVHILPFGVRLDRFRPPETPKRSDGKLRLLYVGQISQRKGLKYLLEAVRRLDDPSIELTLVGGMVGSGAGLKPYEGWFRHVPNVPHHEVQRLFQQADLFVYPSLHEGSANAIFEAMATGLPVVTTRNSGSMVREGQEGHIVPIRDPDALASCIAALRDDPTRRAELGENARWRSYDFTWDRYRADLGTLLDRMLEEKSAATDLAPHARGPIVRPEGYA
jgi:alpha-maltose-1-phosphate synthase